MTLHVRSIQKLARASFAQPEAPQSLDPERGDLGSPPLTCAARPAPPCLGQAAAAAAAPAVAAARPPPSPVVLRAAAAGPPALAAAPTSRSAPRSAPAGGRAPRDGVDAAHVRALRDQVRSLDAVAARLRDLRAADAARAGDRGVGRSVGAMRRPGFGGLSLGRIPA